jgi:hypothetical protein
MFKIINATSALAILLTGSTNAFVPSNKPFHASARKSSLSMSAALIVQNKGGGHGEIGEFNIYVHDIVVSHQSNVKIFSSWIIFLWDRIPISKDFTS